MTTPDKAQLPQPRVLRDYAQALNQAIDYMQSEHGKSQQGYFSEGGWSGRTLRELRDQLEAWEKGALSTVPAAAPQGEPESMRDYGKTPKADREQADQHLRAMLRYTESFYASAIQHGMRAADTANAIAHVEKAGKALHRLVHAWATVAEQQATPPAAAEGALTTDERIGLRRYLNDVLQEGTANERVVAQTALRMIATPPAALSTAPAPEASAWCPRGCAPGVCGAALRTEVCARRHQPTPAVAPSEALTEAQINAMADRLMGWPLPRDFAPDCGISFDGRKDDQWNKGKTWPVGTNLLTVDQARAMFRYVAAALATPTEAAASALGVSPSEASDD